MNNTYYVIEKKYKGFFTKKHSGNRSYIITTITKTGEGICFVPIGIHLQTSKLLLWSAGIFSDSGDIIVSSLKETVPNTILLEKIPSVCEEIVNNKINHADLKKWESPLKLNIKLKHVGDYLQSNIKTMLYNIIPNGGVIFICDMKVSFEMNDIRDDQISMVAHKEKALFKAKFGSTYKSFNLPNEVLKYGKI